MGEIYRRDTLKRGTATERKKNEKNRKRNLIMNFRVSPEEKTLIEERIRLSGLSRRDFFLQSCLYQKIKVTGNIKTFDIIREDMKKIAAYLKNGESEEGKSENVLMEMRTILEILHSVYTEAGN